MHCWITCQSPLLIFQLCPVHPLLFKVKRVIFYSCGWNISQVTYVSLNQCCVFLYFIGKLKRLKEAKQEAITEIEIERKERERQYKICEDEVSCHNKSELLLSYLHFWIRRVFWQVFGRRSNTEAQIAAVTEKTLEMQAQSVKAHRDSAIQMLLDNVLTIDPQLHINYQLLHSA